MNDIDWLAVENVCMGYAMKLNRDEQLMAIRRMSNRMPSPGEWDCYGNFLSHAEVGRRMGVDERTVLRRKKTLPDAVKKKCPVCRNDMWVADGVVEPHPAEFYKQCPTSGCDELAGLAGVRPELYAWVWAS